MLSMIVKHVLKTRGSSNLLFTCRRDLTRYTKIKFLPTRRIIDICVSRKSVYTSSKMSQDKVVKICTHDGVFHCDEALAIFLLKVLPRYKDAVIVRSRNEDIIDSCDIVVDVGFKYDPSMHRYDHHMREFKETLRTVMNKPGYDSDIKLSSAGLIYCHFGREIIKELVPPETSDAIIEIIFRRIYYKFIQEIDAVDNGVVMFDGQPAYTISTGLSNRVSRLNPAWNEKTKDVDVQFRKAIDLVGEEFMDYLHGSLNIWLPARSIVENALAKRFEVDASGEIIEQTEVAPWQEHLAELEKEQNIQPSIKYIIFPDTNKSYRVRAIPVEPNSFVCRMFLSEEWAGIRGEDLDKVSGISGCIFVHTGRFIGGHKTREGALEMARKALEIGKSRNIVGEKSSSVM